MNFKSTQNLADFIKNGIPSRKWFDETVTRNFISQIDLNEIAMNLQMWLSPLKENVYVNDELINTDKLFFYIYDVSRVRPQRETKVCVRFFDYHAKRIPKLDEESKHDVFQIYISYPDFEIELEEKNGCVFCEGTPQDLISSLSGNDEFLKLRKNERGHVINPISSVLSMEPTGDLILQLWHGEPQDQQFAIEIGKKFFGYAKEICESMLAGGNRDLFDPDKCYIVFVESEYNHKSFWKIGIVDIETGDPMFTIIPQLLYDKERPHSAVIAGYINSFKKPLLQGTIADIISFFRNRAEKKSE